VPASSCVTVIEPFDVSVADVPAATAVKSVSSLELTPTLVPAVRLPPVTLAPLTEIVLATNRQ
jgi:hypothetical protein